MAWQVCHVLAGSAWSMDRVISGLWGPAGSAAARYRHGRPWEMAFVAVSVAATLLAGVYGGGAGPALPHLAASGWLSGVTALMVLDALRPQPVSPRVLCRLAWSMAPVVVAVQIASFGSDLLRWDLLWCPASLGMVAGWSMVKSTPGRLRRMLRRLADRGVLAGGPDAVEELSRELDHIAHRWAWGVGGGTLAAFVATGPWVGFGLGPGFGGAGGSGIWLGPFGIAYLVPIVLGVAVLGAWSGRLAAYGRLGAVAGRLGLRFRVVPDHPDGASGLRPVGAYFLYQSLLPALWPVYIGAWLVVLAIAGEGLPANRYQPFTDQFWWMLPLAILFEILAFLVPMHSIHTMMRRQKEAALWSESDRLSRRIEELRARLAEAAAGDRAEQEARLDLLVRRFEMLERAPTWPLDASIRKRFTLRNLALLLPLAGYAFGNSSFWEKLADVFTGVR